MANWREMIPELPDYKLHNPPYRLIIVRRSDNYKTTLVGPEAAEAERQLGIAATIGLEAVTNLCKMLEAEKLAELRMKTEAMIREATGR